MHFKNTVDKQNSHHPEVASSVGSATSALCHLTTLTSGKHQEAERMDLQLQQGEWQKHHPRVPQVRGEGWLGVWAKRLQVLSETA